MHITLYQQQGNSYYEPILDATVTNDTVEFQYQQGEMCCQYIGPLSKITSAVGLLITDSEPFAIFASLSGLVKDDAWASVLSKREFKSCSNEQTPCDDFRSCDDRLPVLEILLWKSGMEIVFKKGGSISGEALTENLSTRTKWLEQMGSHNIIPTTSYNKPVGLV